MKNRDGDVLVEECGASAGYEKVPGEINYTFKMSLPKLGKN